MSTKGTSHVTAQCRSINIHTSNEIILIYKPHAFHFFTSTTWAIITIATPTPSLNTTVNNNKIDCEAYGNKLCNQM